MGVEQIKKHPFFYGVDWNSIRNIEAPFIPRLRSITDTSYFPTDELDQVPDEPVGGDTTGAHKDLAFLGYVVPLTSFTLFCLDVRNADARVTQLYVQEVHAFFKRFLIASKDGFTFVCGHEGRTFHPTKRNERSDDFIYAVFPIVSFYNT